MVGEAVGILLVELLNPVVGVQEYLYDFFPPLALPSRVVEPPNVIVLSGPAFATRAGVCVP